MSVPATPRQMSTVLAALAVGIPALALVLSSTAAAATGVPEPSHPGDDFAGSQILRHEDTSRSGVKLTTPGVPRASTSAVTRAASHGPRCGIPA